MKYALSAAILIATAILSLPGCGKRDREEAKKTSDGSDTFVYVKPDLKKYAKKAPLSDAATSEARAASNPGSQKKAESAAPPADYRKE